MTTLYRFVCPKTQPKYTTFKDASHDPENKEIVVNRAAAALGWMMSDIKQQLLDACTGHPAAKIKWPHRLLHCAVKAIEVRDSRIAELESENNRLWRWVVYLWADEITALIDIRREGEPPVQDTEM